MQRRALAQDLFVDVESRVVMRKTCAAVNNVTNK
jgi:hypothetical protein